MLQVTVSSNYTDEFVEMFREALAGAGLHRALQLLNQTTTYRFTGVYCFEPDWVRSVVLFDRENPMLRIGADVPMKESYCLYTARAGEVLVIENAPKDPRWNGHAARDSVLSYVAVLLADRAGTPLGTLCHFDFCGREVPPGSIEILSAVRPTVEAHLRARGVVAHQATSFL
jgi:GAF domain-containing protein